MDAIVDGASCVSVTSSAQNVNLSQEINALHRIMF